MQSVAPEGWTMLMGDDWYRGEPSEDPTSLLYECFPGKTSEWALRAVVMPAVGLEDTPESVGSIESGMGTWQLYAIEGDIPEFGRLVGGVALGETEWGVHLIALTANPEEYDALHEGVFLPAVRATDPVSYGQRDRLTEADLMGAEYQGNSPVNTIYFAPMDNAAPARHELEGTITVPGFGMVDGLPAGTGIPDSWRYFPGFSVEFFTYEDYLVPAVRDIVEARAGRSFWNIILSPGRVWSEPGDGGMSRASFPFALVSEDSNETHNGIATFLYDDARVSSFAFQVVQETAPWHRIDYWGQSPMEYTPGELENGAALAAQFAQELDHQIPIHPWSELEGVYGATALAGFNGDLQPADISATGLMMDGEIYLQPCTTRYGEFPYCRYMRHGSFSVSKSMGAAVAMLRLAEVYGQEVFDLRIADYVEVTASHNGWDAVTFGDALNMATGVGDNQDIDDFVGEESGELFNDFMVANSTQSKLDICFSLGDYPWGPGEIARYNSLTTFILSVAMDSYLKSVAGPDADIWDMVVEEVYAPLGIAHAPILRTRELDGSGGVPIFGYGLYPTVEDVAKVATLLQNGGQHDGQQLLHAGTLARALYQTDEVGFATAEFNDAGEGRYNLAFWSMPYRTSAGEVVLVPYMSGFGGNRIILAPNGITAFRFADAHIYGFESLVGVMDSIEPFPSSGQD
jgi:hypothetical protein